MYKSLRDSKVLAWLWANGHKVLLWIQFIVGALIIIGANPDPQELYDAMMKCAAAGN